MWRKAQTSMKGIGVYEETKISVRAMQRVIPEVGVVGNWSFVALHSRVWGRRAAARRLSLRKDSQTSPTLFGSSSILMGTHVGSNQAASDRPASESSCCPVAATPFGTHFPSNTLD
jgi:hypothetical protein